MFSVPQYSSSELQQYNYFVMQDPVFEEKIEEPVFTCVHEENGVLYCASSTSERGYYYTYALNNPLRFVDPSGYYNKPSDLERERRDGEGRYYNYELAWKMAGMMGSQFGSLMDKSSSGGWTYDKSAGSYSNRFTGETRTAGEFANYSQEASWVASNLNVGWADYSSWAIFETGTSLDHGRTFIGNGNFGVVQIGSVIPTNNNVIFTSRGSADYFLNHRDPWFTLDQKDKIVASVGLFGTWLSSNKGTFRIKKSGRLSLKYYSSGWRGNQYVNRLYSISKVGSGVTLGADAYLTYNAYNKIISSQEAGLLDYSDAVFGTAGVLNSSKVFMFGSSIPVVGEVVALYGIYRLTWDVFYDLGLRYGPFF